jgi:hypothetical protein
MATFTATTEWEIDAATGNANNGGGFDPSMAGAGKNYAWGADQAVTAMTSIANAAGDWTHISCGSHAFDADDVGNTICITGGTGFTTGRYQITGVADGVAALNVACGSGADSTNGTGNLGGSLAGVVPAFIAAATSPVVAGNKVWVKHNASEYTPGANVAAGVACAVTAPALLSGYNTTHGDNPTGSNRPSLNMVGYSFVGGTCWLIRNIAFTGTNAALLTVGQDGLAEDCSAINTSTSASRIAIDTGTGGRVIACEAASRLGTAIYQRTNAMIAGCYVHDSNYGVNVNALGPVVDNIIDSCVTGISVGAVAREFIYGNTIRNCTTGISGSTGIVVSLSNSITGCYVGANWSTKTDGSRWGYNNFYNTTDRTLVTAGDGDVAVDPGFTSGMASGTNGATTGTAFTSVGANFSDLTAADCLVIHATTGGTAGVYAIAAVAPGGDNTALTLATTAGNGTDIVYGVVKGGASSNFGVGTAMKALGFPGAFPGCATTSYTDIGAVQRVEPDLTDYTLTATVVSTIYAARADILSSRTLYTVTGTYHEATTAEVQSGVMFGPDSTYVGEYTGGGTGYTYGDENPDKVLTTATGAGHYHAPDASEVISTATFGVDGVVSGTYDVSDVAAGNIKSGASIGGVAGTYDPLASAVWPNINYVHSDAGSYGPAGNDYTPALSALANYTLISGIAAAGDVRDQVPRYTGGPLGTLIVPGPANVRYGVFFG